MTSRLARYVGATLLLAASTAAGTPNPPLPTVVLDQSDARYDEGPWGNIWVYAEGNTVGTADMFAARLELKPGAEVHPPHKHAEEEYLLILSGRGSWTIGDKSFDAKAGDLLYARPWDLHGVVAAPDSDLAFFVWKWRSETQKSEPVAVKPE
jgi:quercetin dioxygenase-like cupin family protein